MSRRKKAAIPSRTIPVPDRYKSCIVGNIFTHISIRHILRDLRSEGFISTNIEKFCEIIWIVGGYFCLLAAGAILNSFDSEQWFYLHK